MAVLNLRYHDCSGAIRIDRQTIWGNPFKIGTHGDRAQVIALYRRELWLRVRCGRISLEDLAALHDRDLACWCAPQPCHGDVLKSAARWARFMIRRNSPIFLRAS